MKPRSKSASPVDWNTPIKAWPKLFAQRSCALLTKSALITAAVTHLWSSSRHSVVTGKRLVGSKQSYHAFWSATLCRTLSAGRRITLTRFNFQVRLMSSTPLEVVLKRDRLLVLGGLVIVSALAWGYLFQQAHGMHQMKMDSMNMSGMDMTGMDMSMSMAMPQIHSWGALDLLLIFTMWAVMMVAMMVPTAGPMVLLFAAFNRKRREQERPFMPTSLFLLGYLMIWIAFSVIAALAQWNLHRAALLSPMMISTSPVLGGSLLIAAGI